MVRRFLLPLCLLLAFGLPAAGEEKPAPPRADATEARFLVLLRDAAQFLQKTPGYAVDIVCMSRSETADKGPASEHTTHYRLLWQRPGHFRVECTPEGKSTPELVCVSDGKTLTTLLAPRKMYSRDATPQPVEAMRRDTLLAMSLEGSGIPLLLRPDLADYMAGVVSRVQELGVEPLDGGKAEHFKMRWAGQDVDFWLATEGAPLLRQLKRTLVTLVPGYKLQMVTTARLTWQRDEQFPADTFTVRLPEGAHKVGSLYAALVEGGADQLLGKPAPALALKQLDGQPFRLAAHKGKDVTVLLFWATWAAPRAEELTAFGELMKDYHSKGVAFYAVDVGQREGEVKRFVEKHPFQSPVVLDPHSESVDAYGLTALPCLVLLGKDGTVQACCRGTTAEERAQLRKDLNALLKGESLIPGVPAKSPSLQKQQ